MLCGTLGEKHILLPGHVLQRIDLRGIETRLAENGGAERFGVLFRVGPGRIPAQGHGLVEKPFGRRHGAEVAHFRTAARLAHDRDILRVAAESFDIVAHPLEGCHDVEHPCVAR